jgi:hypothetical protein
MSDPEGDPELEELEEHVAFLNQGMLDMARELLEDDDDPMFDAHLNSLIDFFKDTKKRKKRQQLPVKHLPYFQKTQWFQIIHHPDIRDPSSTVGRLFRRRFRVPFPLFERLLLVIETQNILGVQREARVQVPTAIKLLIVFRVLGRDECFDTINELCGVSEERCRMIFTSFVKRFREYFEKDYIGIRDAEDLKSIMTVYKALGTLFVLISNTIVIHTLIH